MSRHRDTYSTSELQTMFSVAYETIRQRVIEFEKHLSPTANPGDGRPRRFSEDDVKILALVDDMRPTSTTEEIHAAIQSGQRGDMPDLQAIAIEETDPTIAAEFSRLKQREGELAEQVERLQSERDTWRDRANKLEGQLEAVQGQLALLQAGSNDASVSDRIIALERKLAVTQYQLDQARQQAGKGGQND